MSYGRTKSGLLNTFGANTINTSKLESHQGTRLLGIVSFIIIRNVMTSVLVFRFVGGGAMFR